MRDQDDPRPASHGALTRGSRSLVLRIVITFLVLSTLMVGVVAAIAYGRARAELEASQRARLATVQVLTVDALQRWLDEQRRNVVFAAGLLGGVERRGTLPQARGSVAALVDENASRSESAHAERVVGRTLTYAVEQSSDAQELLVLDPGGQVLVSTTPAHVGMDLSSQLAVADGVASTQVTPLAETPLRGGPTVLVMTPLYDDSGRARATLAAALDVARLDQVVLTRTGLGGGGRTYLVSSEREVFARGPGTSVSSVAIERALAGDDGESSYDDYAGTPVIGSWSWVPSIGAALVSEVPESVAFAPARDLARWIAIIGAAVVAALAALTWVAAQRIARPILAITDAAQGVRAGDLERVAPVTTRDEVGDLAVAFNEMTDQLRRNVVELEHRVAERTRELSTQKRYFETLVEISPAAVVTMDTELCVTGWNPAAERLFGYRAAEVIGTPVDDLVLTSDAMRREGLDVAAEAWEHGRVDRVTQRARKDGSLVDVEIVMVPLMVDGRHVGAYAIYHDVTELHEARLEADRANEAKSAFLAAMSHEIRTPLNAIIGLGTLLHDSDLTLEQADFVGAITASGEGLLAVINDVLDLSKIEAGRMELDLVEADPVGVVEQAVELLASAADWQTGIVLDVSGEVPARVMTDSVRLRQVVLNLVGNALKFTESGGRVVVSVRAEPIGTDAAQVMLEVGVTDTGVGITPEQQERLFDRFVQATSETQRRYGGTGLGLAISRRLAELMGGTLELTSPVLDGAGSRFDLVVPVDVVAPPEVREVAGLTGRLVVVAHHDPLVADVLAARLEEAGAQVHVDGAGRLGAWSGVSAAVLDAGLPATAAALGGTATPPVVVVSRVPRWRAAELLGWTPPATVPWLTEPVRTRSLVRALSIAWGVRADDSDTVETGSSTPAQLPPLHVLVAEDNLVNQKLVRAMLARLGLTPDIVGDGAAAVAAVREASYDVALLDLRMPGMDGLEAARMIVEGEPGGAPLPVLVALTADVGEADRAAARAAGMTEFLAKPLRPEELYDVLARVPVRNGSPPIVPPPSLERLRSVAGDDDELARELAQTFVQGVPGLVAQLGDAVDHESDTVLRLVAHTLKSHGALLGDTQLEHLARQVENLLGDGRVDEARAAARRLRGAALETAARWDEVVS